LLVQWIGSRLPACRSPCRQGRDGLDLARPLLEVRLARRRLPPLDQHGARLLERQLALDQKLGFAQVRRPVVGLDGARLRNAASALATRPFRASATPMRRSISGSSTKSLVLLRVVCSQSAIATSIA
jgi:hypothetical protein